MKTTTFTAKSWLGLLLCLNGLLSFVAPGARADEEKDPPSRVARISYIEGSVSLQPGGEGEWGSAAKNRPVTVGDKLWADKDSRVELQAGEASIHLGGMTALSFLNLDQNIIQMRLAEGSANFRVRELREGDLYEVDTPNAAFTVKQAGAFRVDVSENGDGTRVTVIRGEGEVTAGGKTYEVHSGERADFNGSDNNIEYSVNQAPGPDGFDRWAEQRDLKEDNSVSARYVSRDTVGYSDLDDNGTWSEVPEYGHVWYPNVVDPGWAPYSSGYWNWVGPWGWTWVDYSPWGFAPYHYGRWNYFGDRWGWCPGPIGVYPIYGPAFVGFLGGGVGFGFGGGFGAGVGWFPLGFGEPFFPWFHCRDEFRERINVHNTFIRNTNVFNTNVRNVNFVNAHNVNAVTVANRNAFTNGQAINRGAVHLTPAALKGAQVTNSVGLKPTQHSSLGAANINSHVATPPVAVQNRSVMARTTPGAAASRMPVRTMNTTGLAVGRTGNAPVNNSVNRPANGAMNQRPGTPNAPTRNTPALNGRPANTPGTSTLSPRQRDLSQNRPPSAVPNSARTPNNAATSNNAPQRASNSPRTWEAQSNATDRGRAPAGFGRSNSPANAPSQTARMNQGNRPPWVGGSQSGVSQARPQGSISEASRGAGNPPASRDSARPSMPNYNGNRSSNSNSGRSYQPPQRTQRDMSVYNDSRSNSQPRSYNPPPTQRDTPAYNNNRSNSQPRSYNPPPTRSYSAPSRSYSPPSRTYSAPSRSYPAPSRSYSAPSRSSGGGGGSPHGGGGSSPHGGGGSVSHGHR